MTAQVSIELEEAAQVLLGPPNLVTKEQRSAAENVLLNFRKSKCPYKMCKDLLETCKNDYVLFEASGLIKDALIREWRELTASDIQELRTYLLQYVVNNPACSAFVRERIVQVIAIMVKRQSVDDNGRDRAVVVREVQDLITSGNQQMQMIGCAIITAVLQEYATTVKSSDVGLPWEMHFILKKRFEATDLQTIFKFSVHALKELAPLIVLPISNELAHLLRRLVIISEMVLSWTFINVHLPKKLISVFESDQNPSLRPGAAWKEIILDPMLVSFFFDLHWRVRSNSDIAHHTISCLVQLASLNGQTLNEKRLRLEYLTSYIRSLTHLIDLCKVGTIPGKEALGISNIVRKLILFYPPNIMVNIEAELLHKYLEQLVSLTCGFLRTSSVPGGDEDDKLLFNEAFENTLEAWISIVNESQLFPNGYCREAAVAIFNCYLEVHLAAPEGNRPKVDCSEDEEIDESEEKDRIRYKDTLCVVGALGRECLDTSLPTLITLIESRITRLHSHIQRSSSQGATQVDSLLADLYEDLHWILLIAGNVVSSDVDGETALIPPEVMQHSIGQSSMIDITKSLEVLASPGKPASDIPGYESSDHILRLMGDVFRLAEVEKRALEAGLSHLWSPLVASSIIWFLRRWSLTYVVIQETFYQEISTALVTAFGKDTDGSKWTLSFLLDKALSNITRFSSEPEVMEDTVLLLISFADTKEKCLAIANNPGLLNLIQLGTQYYASLPSQCKKGILKALVQIGGAQDDIAFREQYWSQVLKPLECRYQSIVENPNLKTIYMDENVRCAVIDLLESFVGVINGCQVSTVHQVFALMRPTIASLVQLLSLYHNYNQVVELILEVYCETAKRILCYFTPAESRAFYEASLAIIKTYADHQVGKRIYTTEMEEEQYKDILLFMELLTNLLSKDFIDLSPLDNNQEDNTIVAADVCLYGLNILMPLMSRDLLRFPSLSLQYYKFITFLCEIFPEKVIGLEPGLQDSLVASLQLGLSSLGMDPVFSLCCDFVQVLGCYMVKHNKRDSTIYEKLRPFLKLFLDLILSQQINTELIPISAGTLYVLICLFQDTYEQLIEVLVQSQDEINRPRLMEAFANLTANIPLTAERVQRIRFRDSFEKFIVNVRGFLFVK